MHHAHLVALGESLGFRPEREASLAPIEGGYAPRLDVLWSQSLSVLQQKAIRKVGANLPALRGDALPIAAWEVEGSDSSTKGMQADLTNMRVSRAPYAFLAVRGDTKDNLYERACRLTRTQRHHFGDRAAVPLDTSWISELGKGGLSSQLSPVRARRVRGGGGEGRWADQVRANLREIGEGVGFLVADSFSAFAPQNADFTKSEIDLVWMLPMPKGLRRLVETLAERDPTLVRDGLIVPERYEQVVVVAFEIENDSSKHGFGGLLNLAAHGVAGVFVAGDETASKRATAALQTYAGVLSLSNVSIHDGFRRPGRTLG